MDITTLKKSMCKVSNCDSGDYMLKEKNPNATLKQVCLCDIPKGSLIIKMDGIRFDNFLKDCKEWGYNKHSDYLIITELDLVFIELKSKKDINDTLINTCRQKFASDTCTIYYADKIFQELLSKNTFFEKRNRHYVLLYQAPSILKRTTEFTKPSANNTPETFRKIAIQNGEILSFNKTL